MEMYGYISFNLVTAINGMPVIARPTGNPLVRVI